jgi:hypothetical protein
MAELLGNSYKAKGAQKLPTAFHYLFSAVSLSIRSQFSTHFSV